MTTTLHLVDGGGPDQMELVANENAGVPSGTSGIKNAAAQLVQHIGNGRAVVVLLLLFSADAAFLLVHLIHSYTPFLGEENYSLSRDRGYAEIFQYIKEYWIALALVVIGIRTRVFVYGAWSLLFAYLLFDDAFQAHERYGAKLVELLGYLPHIGLRAQDFGELTASALAGTVLLALISGGYRYAGSEGKRASRDLALLLVLLVCFGVVFDILQIAVDPASVFFTMLEDGGELLAMTAIVWYVVNLIEYQGRPPVYLTELARSAFRPRVRVVEARKAP